MEDRYLTAPVPVAAWRSAALLLAAKAARELGAGEQWKRSTLKKALGGWIRAYK